MSVSIFLAFKAPSAGFKPSFMIIMSVKYDYSSKNRKLYHSDMYILISLIDFCAVDAVLTTVFCHISECWRHILQTHLT